MCLSIFLSLRLSWDDGAYSLLVICVSCSTVKLATLQEEPKASLSPLPLMTTSVSTAFAPSAGIFEGIMPWHVLMQELTNPTTDISRWVSEVDRRNSVPLSMLMGMMEDSALTNKQTASLLAEFGHRMHNAGESLLSIFLFLFFVFPLSFFSSLCMLPSFTEVNFLLLYYVFQCNP